MEMGSTRSQAIRTPEKSLGAFKLPSYPLGEEIAMSARDAISHISVL